MIFERVRTVMNQNQNFIFVRTGTEKKKLIAEPNKGLNVLSPTAR